MSCHYVNTFINVSQNLRSRHRANCCVNISPLPVLGCVRFVEFWFNSCHVGMPEAAASDLRSDELAFLNLATSRMQHGSYFKTTRV